MFLALLCHLPGHFEMICGFFVEKSLRYLTDVLCKWLPAALVQFFYDSTLNKYLPL